MTYRLLALLFLVPVFGAPTPTAGQLSDPSPDRAVITTSVSPTFGYMFGHTTYELDVGYGTERLQSILEFPANSFSLGGALEISSTKSGRLAWRLAAAADYTPTDPSGTMVDTDLGYLGSGIYDIWSYTESDPQGHALNLNVTFYRTLFMGPRWTVGIVGGLHYFRLTQFLDNFEGWQIVDANLTKHFFAVTDLPAIDYRVTYLTPEIGAAGTVNLTPALTSDWQLLYGRVRATDEDDHLLRKKLSTGSGWGNQLRAAAGARLLLPGGHSANRTFVGLGLQLQSLRVAGVQDQEFYEDVVEYDPITEQEYTIPKGTRFENLPHEFRSTRFTIQVRVGRTF